MTAPRVSVAICTRNGEQYIGEQLRSILAQSLVPDEIVLSDDASTDRTLAKAQAAFDEHLRSSPSSTVQFRVLNNAPALGVTANFERAMLNTTGDLIALSDQDDVWERERLARIVEIFSSRAELDLLHGDATLIDSVGLPIEGSLFDALEVSAEDRSAIHRGHAFPILMRRNVVTGATVVLRRRLLLRAVPFPEGWLHDEWVGMVAAASGQLDVIDERLIRYRQHGGNQIGAVRLSALGKVRRMLEPGSERTRRLVIRATALAERFSRGQPPVPAEYVLAAREKLAHERFRSSLSRRRIARLLPLFREWRSGRYSDFGRGIADVFRDALQPLNSLR